jgi:AcrR family transcriptional regulator
VTDVTEASRTPRAEKTRTAVVTAALDLFRERGYDAATMRAIAERAGVSTGNAYYYFGSKEELIQEFYSRNQAEHLAASQHVLATETDLGERLRGTLRAQVTLMAPYHEFAATLYKYAAEPTSPLSPFSPQSSPARQASIALFRDVVEGSKARMGADVRERLPELLWLYSLGITLYWVHDRSDGCSRTYQLIDATVQVVAQLVSASRLPVLRRALADLLQVIDLLSPDGASAPNGASG